MSGPHMNGQEFAEWLLAHKTMNPATDWSTFEDSHASNPYRAWQTWVHRERVGPEDAYAASQLLAQAPIAQRRDAENHLYLLSRAVKSLREKGVDASAPQMPLDRERARSESAGCRECSGNGLTGRRFLVEIDGRPQSANLAFACLCPYGAWFARNGQFWWLGDWPSLWPKDVRHHSWPELPPPGQRRIFGGWHMASGTPVRVVRCLDDVLFPDLAEVAIY